MEWSINSIEVKDSRTKGLIIEKVIAETGLSEYLEAVREAMIKELALHE